MSVDSDAENLALMINNDGRLYESVIKETKTILAKKMLKGDYNSIGAKKAWLNVVEKVLKDPKFKREYREYLSEMNLSPNVRRLAREYVMAHQTEETVRLYKTMLKEKLEKEKHWSTRR